VVFEGNCVQTNKDRPILSATRLFSGGVKFMRTFAGLLWGGGVKRQWVQVQNGNYASLSVDIGYRLFGVFRDNAIVIIW